MIATDLVQTGQAFLALKDEWEDLQTRADASVFQSWAWCWHWWSLYRGPKKLALVAARDKDRLVGVAPLCLSTSQLGVRTPGRVLAFLGSGPADYGGFVLDRELAPAVCDALIARLALLTWDAIDLHQLRVGGLLHDRLSRADWGGAKVQLLQQEATLAAPLSDSFDDYLKGLSKKFRTNLTYARRRLERDHDLSIDFVTRPQDVPGQMQVFYKLHQKRWRHKKLPGLFLSGKNRRFHQELGVEMAKRDQLALAFLNIKGRAVAAFYGYRYGGTLYYYLGGFDPDWAKWSVSSVLIHEIIREAAADGCRTFDLLRGEESYKNRWGAELQANGRIIISRPTLKSLLVANLLAGQNLVVQKARARLHK